MTTMKENLKDTLRKMTTKDQVYYVLFKTDAKVALHEFKDIYKRITGEELCHNEHTISRALNYMEKDGYIHYSTGNRILIDSRKREDKNYKEWYLTNEKNNQKELF